jgi:hypothetical protein
MNPLRPLVLAVLLSSLAGCASTSASGGPDQGASKEGQPSAQDKLRKKQRELEYARLKLQIARMGAESGEQAAREAVSAAEHEVERAGVDLRNFLDVARGLELAERDLALDRARQSVVEDEQELSELEAMYAVEQFADMTKELVLTRGRARLEMSKRSLDLALRNAEQLRSFEHPRKEHELTRGLERRAEAGRALPSGRRGYSPGSFARRAFSSVAARVSRNTPTPASTRSTSFPRPSAE